MAAVAMAGSFERSHDANRHDGASSNNNVQNRNTMSGPIEHADLDCHNKTLAGTEVKPGRIATVGGGRILRVLPTKGRRTVGAWCFTDLSGTDAGQQQDPMEVGPHPHMGLATVTWLLEGEALHTDSLGSEQVIRPGELNLMHAGAGIAHSEQGGPTRFRGAQMWVAQPEGTRHDASGFEHHGELPRVEVGPAADATVFMGAIGDGPRSPARMDTALIGAQLDLRPGRTEVPVDVRHQHAIVPLDRPISVAGQRVEVGALALVATGTDVLPLEARDLPTSVLLLGGEPLGEEIQMWWNFVARTREELTQAWRDWQAHDEDRFGPVASSSGRIVAPTPPWIGAG
ncbi:MAG: redox-sensitive bicupin YhaK (pirin superfamily) [Glaciecola sp.]|jgi:redox-sensitive bicupin YhaK (pirin superfamily)